MEVGITLQRGGVWPTMEKGVSLNDNRIDLQYPLPKHTEIIPIDAARGRLSIDTSIEVDDPRFDNSAMDGFAVIASGGKPSAELTIIGTSQTGGKFLHR